MLVNDKLKAYGWKWSWTTLRYFYICLEERRKTTETWVTIFGICAENRIRTSQILRQELDRLPQRLVTDFHNQNVQNIKRKTNLMG